MISVSVQALLYRSIATVLGISQKLSEKGGFEKNGRKIYHDRGNSMDFKHSIRSMGVQQHPTYLAITYEKEKGQQILVNKKGDAVAKPTVNLVRCCRNSIDSNFLQTQSCRPLEGKVSLEI